MGERAHKTRGEQIVRQADDGNRLGRFLCRACRGITDAKDNVWGGLEERRRDFRILLIAQLKATGNDLQVLPLNEAERLEFVKKTLPSVGPDEERLSLRRVGRCVRAPALARQALEAAVLPRHFRRA